MIIDTLLLFHCCEFFHTLIEASGSLLMAVANALLSKKTCFWASSVAMLQRGDLAIADGAKQIIATMNMKKVSL